MKDELVRKLIKKFNLTDILLIDKQTGTAVPGEKHVSRLSKWLKMFSDNQESNFLIDDTEWVYNGKDIIVILFGAHMNDQERVHAYMKEHEPWLKLLLIHSNEQKRRSSLHLLMGVSHILASRMYEEDILDIIIESVVEAVSNADTGFLFLYDEKIEKLLVMSAVGFKEESYKKTRLKKGEGVSGMVFETGEPILLQGSTNIRNAMNTMSKANFTYYLNSTSDKSFPESILSIPLRFQGKIVGVLTVDSFKDHSYLTEHDLELLKALADHIAVVIMHAKLYKQEKKQKEELEKTHSALRNEHETMQRTTDFHHRLTNIAARGEGADAIVETMQKVVRHPFAIYDSLLKPYFIDKDAENKTLPKRFLSHDRVKKVIKMNKWQQIRVENEQLVVLPIIGVESLWGFLCVWIDSTDFYKNDIVLYEYGSTVLSLELTKQDSIKAAEQRAKGELVEGLLTEGRNPMLEMQASNLGFTPHDFYVMVLGKVDPSITSDGGMTENYSRYKEEILEVFENGLQSIGINGIVSMNRTYMFAMISFPEEDGKLKARESMKSYVQYLEKTSAPVKVGVGRVHKSLFELNQSFSDAEKCMKLLESQQNKKIISALDAGFHRFFLQHSEEELNIYVTDILGPLIHYDEEKNNELLETLLAYIRFDKNVSAITDKLNIHYNTLYYRIKRIQEIIDVNFNQFDDWFNVQLACHVYEYLNK